MGERRTDLGLLEGEAAGEELGRQHVRPAERHMFDHSGTVEHLSSNRGVGTNIGRRSAFRAPSLVGITIPSRKMTVRTPASITDLAKYDSETPIFEPKSTTTLGDWPTLPTSCSDLSRCPPARTADQEYRNVRQSRRESGRRRGCRRRNRENGDREFRSAWRARSCPGIADHRSHIAANDGLGEVLKLHRRIDLLKIDIEGVEERVLNSIDQATLGRVHLIYVEAGDNDQLVPDTLREQFTLSSHQGICRYGNRNLS